MLFRAKVCLSFFKALQAAEGGNADSYNHSEPHISYRFGGKASRCTSWKRRGSMTVEAALAFPLFLFALTAFLYLFFVIQLRTEIGRAMTDAGREFAQNAYLLEDSPGMVSGAAAAFSGSREVKEYLNQRAAAKLIRGGADGIFWMGTVWKDEEDTLVLCAEYEIEALPVPGMFHSIRIVQKRTVRGWTGFTGREHGSGTGRDKVVYVTEHGTVLPVPGMFHSIRIVQKRTVRGWTGFTGREHGSGTGRDKVVYVTEHGTVYHQDAECRHLKLSVRQCSLEEAKAERNTGGAKYYPCERCWKEGSRLVYLTEDGDRYHQSLSCSSLTRRIRTILLSEAGGRPPCSVCGGG